MEISLSTLALLMGAAFLAGLVDAVAGGGGLITVPAVLSVGLPPHVALGTNKGQAPFGTVAALYRYTRAKMVDGKRAKLHFPLGFVGSLGGAALVLLMRPETLRPIVLVLLVAVALFLAVRRPVAHPEGHPPPKNAVAWGALIAVACGLYDGFFGPGTGTFLIVGFVGLVGLPLAKASADAKVVNLASNLGAMLLFSMRGAVLWKVSLPMAAASMCGGFVGAHLAVKGGDKFVRWFVVAVVIALLLKQATALLT
ncbi:MAG: TSUP family transporter [Myxococcaceae bacterium]